MKIDFTRTRLPSMPAIGQSFTIAVWGPSGSPGCSTVAAGIASSIARQIKNPLLLIDGDLSRGGLTLHLARSRIHTLGTILALRQRPESPTAVSLLHDTHWNVRVLPGIVGNGAPISIDLDEYKSLIRELSAETPITVIDIGDELPPRSRGDFHKAALELADVIVIVGAASPLGQHDFLLEYRLLDNVISSFDHAVSRCIVINHMHDDDILKWTRLVKNELGLPLTCQLPHDWPAAYAAQKRQLPIPIGQPNSTLGRALDELGMKVLNMIANSTDSDRSQRKVTGELA